MKPRNKRTTEEKFYDGLVKLMKRKEYKNITITDVAAEAGLSRMTFYRHFDNVADVMTRHLKRVLAEAESKIRSKQDFTKKSFWLEIIKIVREDPVNENLMSAGMITLAFNSEVDFMVKIYQTYFGLDMFDEKAIIKVYSTIGSIFGCFFYVSMNNNDSTAELIAERLVEIAAQA